MQLIFISACGSPSCVLKHMCGILTPPSSSQLEELNEDDDAEELNDRLSML